METLWADLTKEERDAKVATWTREIPLASNGYAPVAQCATTIPASEVRVGDVLMLDRYVSRVTHVQQLGLTGRFGETLPAWHAMHILGDVNILRFPHELVSVIRRSE